MLLQRHERNMEEKKFDLNSLIGFVLLGAIMIWYFYMNQPTPEELEKQKTEQIQEAEQADSEQAEGISEPGQVELGTHFRGGFRFDCPGQCKQPPGHVRLQ